MADRLVGVLVFIVALAALAVAVSKKSQTAKVLDAFLGGFSKSIRAAVSPVTGK